MPFLYVMVIPPHREFGLILVQVQGSDKLRLVPAFPLRNRNEPSHSRQHGPQAGRPDRLVECCQESRPCPSSSRLSSPEFRLPFPANPDTFSCLQPILSFHFDAVQIKFICTSDGQTERAAVWTEGIRLVVRVPSPA